MVLRGRGGQHRCNWRFSLVTGYRVGKKAAISMTAFSGKQILRNKDFLFCVFFSGQKQRQERVCNGLAPSGK
ncbi:hypothetical protein PVK06_010748 [Gossypium arboreum]|uniref:Uncharacterized protein n=1 Tax=Gossypium arboreum TaxID=29729 RepID=A0ABR0Q6Z3_GOSAR|nr:hypothetical protein PVK06_010748 [Gossypium arboreum]